MSLILLLVKYHTLSGNSAPADKLLAWGWGLAAVFVIAMMEENVDKKQGNDYCCRVINYTCFYIILGSLYLLSCLVLC